MSDDFETVSVEAEISGLVSAVPAEPVSAPAEETQAYVPEAMPAEIEATQLNLDAGDETLKQNSQQVYNENNGRVSDSAPAITQKGRDEQEAAKEEKKGEFLAVLEQSAKEAERRNEWLNKPDHEFGGMKMSGHDLDKLINFYSANPEMLGKLQSRLSKNNDPEKIKKGVKEFQEALALEKKKSQGKQLTPEEQARYLELQKSEEFKVVAQEAAIFAQSHGIKVNPKMAEARAEIAAAVSGAEVDVIKVAGVTQKVLAEQSNAKKVETLKAEEDDGMIALGDVEPVAVAAAAAPTSAASRVAYVEASARDSFHSVPPVHKDFEASSGILLASSEKKKSVSLETQLQSGLENKDVEVSSTDMPVSVVTSQKMPLAMGARA